VTLYRVFAFDAAGRSSQPGGALFAPPAGAGRIANPELYYELYLSTTAAGAVSEVFGRLDTWTQTLFAGRGLPYAIARYELYDSAPVCNLDNAARLLALDLAPSDVVARDRTVTQSWAARIYACKKWIGIAWWSRYESRWQSMGLWNRKQLRLKGRPELLSTRHPAVLEAVALLPRRLELS
jgi:RES domain-containing protein